MLKCTLHEHHLFEASDSSPRFLWHHIGKILYLLSITDAFICARWVWNFRLQVWSRLILALLLLAVLVGLGVITCATLTGERWGHGGNHCTTYLGSGVSPLLWFVSSLSKLDQGTDPQLSKSAYLPKGYIVAIVFSATVVSAASLSYWSPC